MSEIFKLLVNEQVYCLIQSFSQLLARTIQSKDRHSQWRDYLMNPVDGRVLEAYAIAYDENITNGCTVYRGYYIDIFYPLYNKTMRLMHSDKPSPLGIGTKVSKGNLLLLEDNIGIGVTGYHHHVDWFSLKDGTDLYEAFSKQRVIETNIPPEYLNEKIVIFIENDFYWFLISH